MTNATRRTRRRPASPCCCARRGQARGQTWWCPRRACGGPLGAADPSWPHGTPRPRPPTALAAPPRRLPPSPSLRPRSDLLKIPVWWRCAVLPSLPWALCFLSFFLQPKIGMQHGTSSVHASTQEINKMTPCLPTRLPRLHGPYLDHPFPALACFQTLSRPRGPQPSSARVVPRLDAQRAAR